MDRGCRLILPTLTSAARPPRLLLQRLDPLQEDDSTSIPDTKLGQELLKTSKEKQKKNSSGGH